MAKFQLQEASAAFQDQLINEAKVLAKRHSLSRFVLEGLLSYCIQHNVVRPAYSSLQDMVSSALMAERNRLSTTFCRMTYKDLHAQLDKLLEDDNLFYNLTLVKKDQKNFSITEIRTTIAKQQLTVGIYAKSLALMPSLGIS